MGFSLRFLAGCLAAALLLLLPAIQATGAETPLAELPDWVFDGSDELAAVPEPSGMCYCPATDTLFVVDDGGVGRPAGVYELDLDAQVLQGRELGQDLEGICYCEVDGLLYVVDEAEELVYMLEPEGLEQVGEFTFEAEFEGQPLLQPGGNGIEGIEYIHDADVSYFLLLNQDDPHALLRIDYDIAQGCAIWGNDAPLEDWWPLPAINLGELHYDAANRELWVVHSWMNVMEILDVATMELKRWEVIPGRAQEAVAVDGEGRLWIGADSGGIDRYVRPGAEPGPDE